MNCRVLYCAALVGLVAGAPVAAEAGLPKLPTRAQFIGVVAAPQNSLTNLEAMAARVGMAPPEAKAGWIFEQLELGVFATALDLTRPIVLASNAPKIVKGKAPQMQGVAYLPLKPGDEESHKVLTKLFRKDQLATRREGDYLLVSNKAGLLSPKARRRVLTPELLASAQGLDVALLADPRALNRQSVNQALGAAGESASDPLGQALLETLLRMSAESQKKGTMSVFGLSVAKDGLRLVHRDTKDPKSTLGSWALAAPPSRASLVTGHAAGPMLGSLGAVFDGPSTAQTMQVVLQGTRARLPKAQAKTLEPLAAVVNMLKEAMVAHPAISVVVRPGLKGTPRVVAILPRLDPALLKQMPDLKAHPADPALKLPSYYDLALSPEASLMVVDAGDRSVLTLAVPRMEVSEVVAEAKTEHVPMADNSRYRAARKALPEALVFEMYLDPGPIFAMVLESGEAASLKPIAQLAGALPPIAVGRTVQGQQVETQIFVGDGVLGMVSMVAGLMFQRSEAPDPASEPAPRPAPTSSPAPGPSTPR